LLGKALKLVMNMNEEIKPIAYSFFPVKIIKILSKENKDIKSDDSIQVAVESLAGMKSICAIHPDIQNEIKEGDFAIVDWSAIILPGTNPLAFTPRAIITKILSGETKDTILNMFSQAKEQTVQAKKIKEQGPSRYIG